MVDLDKAGPSRRTLWPGMLLINGMKPLGKKAMTDINAQQEVRNASMVLWRLQLGILQPMRSYENVASVHAGPHQWAAKILNKIMLL